MPRASSAISKGLVDTSYLGRAAATAASGAGGTAHSLFSGFSQQDAQEFLRFLLDGLHNEVNRVTGRPKSNPENLDHLP